MQFLNTSITDLNLLLIGFSVFASTVLLTAYLFFLSNLKKTWISKLSCIALLVGLSNLQLEHWSFLQSGKDPLNSQYYCSLLFLIPPAFYFFCRSILLPDAKNHPGLLLHVLPLLASIFIASPIEIPVAFLLGAGYCFWFAQIIYGLRAQRQRFKIELSFLVLFSFLALIILIVGFSIPYIDSTIFINTYTLAIGLAQVLIVAALIIFPELLTDIDDVVNLTYASSTLKGIDVPKTAKRLDALMSTDKIFQSEQISLTSLAEQVELSPHQLSELINTEFKCGFSKYIREHRIREAKQILIDEPNASILSVSLAVGFKSQSNFYTAFKGITGMSPGNYRKKSTASKL